MNGEKRGTDGSGKVVVTEGEWQALGYYRRALEAVGRSGGDADALRKAALDSLAHGREVERGKSA